VPQLPVLLAGWRLKHMTGDWRAWLMWQGWAGGGRKLRLLPDHTQTQVWSEHTVLLVLGYGCGCRMCCALVLLHPSGAAVVIVHNRGYCVVKHQFDCG
jgi:hypothetical protein